MGGGRGGGGGGDGGGGGGLEDGGGGGGGGDGGGGVTSGSCSRHRLPHTSLRGAPGATPQPHSSLRPSTSWLWAPPTSWSCPSVGASTPKPCPPKPSPPNWGRSVAGELIWGNPQGHQHVPGGVLVELSLWVSLWVSLRCCPRGCPHECPYGIVSMGSPGVSLWWCPHGYPCGCPSGCPCGVVPMGFPKGVLVVLTPCGCPHGCPMELSP